jgi:hypothetical protein
MTRKGKGFCILDSALALYDKEKGKGFCILDSALAYDKERILYFALCTSHLHDEESIFSTDQAHLIVRS